MKKTIKNVCSAKGILFLVYTWCILAVGNMSYLTRHTSRTISVKKPVQSTRYLTRMLTLTVFFSILLKITPHRRTLQVALRQLAKRTSYRATDVV